MAKLSEKEAKQYRDLTDYILELYLNAGYDKKDINWTLITSQIKNMGKDGLKYSGILLTLKCMTEHEVNIFNYDTGSILNLVPYYYNKAKVEWVHRQEILKSAYEFDFNDNIIEVGNRTQNRKPIIDLEF